MVQKSESVGYWRGAGIRPPAVPGRLPSCYAYDFKIGRYPKDESSMLNKYFKNKTIAIFNSRYKQMLILYSLFTVIVITLSAALIIGNYNKSLVKEAEKANFRLLTQVQVTSDIFLEESIYSLVYDKFIDLAKDKNISDYFSGGKNDDIQTLFRIREFLENAKASNKFIDSIHLYRKADNTLVSSRIGAAFSLFDAANRNDQLINTDVVRKIMRSAQPNLWITPLENYRHWSGMRFINSTFNIYTGANPMITYAVSIPLMNNKRNKLGCLMIDIDEKRFFKSILHTSDLKLGELIIIDSEANVFSRGRHELLLKEDGLEAYIKNAVTGNQGFSTVTANGQVMGISWIKSAATDWWYVSTVPIETLNQQALLAKQFTFIIMAFIILVSVISVNLITVRVYGPFRRFVKNAAKKMNLWNESDNEIIVVNNIITRLSSRVEEVENTLKANQGVIKYKIVTDIINGLCNSTEDDVRQRLRMTDEYLDYKYFCFSVFEYDFRELSELPVEQREYVSYKLIEIIHAFYNDKCANISIPYGRNRIAALLNYDGRMNIVGSQPEIQQTILKELGIHCNISLSQGAEQLMALSDKFDYACGLLRYSFIYGYGNLFDAEKMLEMESRPQEFDSELFEQLLPMMKACKTAQLKEHVGAIFRTIKENGYSYNFTQNLLLQFIRIFAQGIHEYDNPKTMLENMQLLHDFNRITTLDECHAWINGLIDAYAKLVEARNSMIDNGYIEKIANYITQNIEEDIKLINIAARFGISPNHLSRVFKSGTGICFSDFVLEKKLERAKELLLNGKNAKITDIAEKLGYSNTTYFISIFKKKFGITPAKMKKSSIS